MACFEQLAYGEPDEKRSAREGTAAVDVAAKLRGMWA
jgi:hypothetical protein